MADQSIYKQLAATVGAGDSNYIYNIFKILANGKEARLLLAAAPPTTIQGLAKKSGLEEQVVKRMIEPLFAKGLLFKSKKPDGTRYYRVRHVIQMHDSTAVAEGASRTMLDLWKRFMAEEFDRYSRMIEQALPAAAVRVIPVNISITPKARILAFDDIKQIVANARNLAITSCSCRVIEGNCGKPVEVCVQIDRSADYAIERGTGKKLDKSQALELMKMCEEEGLVHVSDNRRMPGHVICNCCSDCCLNWPSVRTGLGKFVVPSRFSAVVDDALCSACETCLDRCHFDAISMLGENDTAVIDSGKCMGCGLCLVTCPDNAIVLNETRPAEFIPE